VIVLLVRLQKYLAAGGIGSRRRCEAIISEGRVTVNDRVVTEPGTKVGEADSVEVDGIPVRALELRYYILNKPRGWISVDRDPRGRRYVIDLIPGAREQGCFPVGRLDIDTTGLLIVTNDGDMANAIAHPRGEVEKTYEAILTSSVDRDRVMALERDGAILEDGSCVEDIKVRSIEERGGGTWVKLTIHEGRRHVVKRLFRSIGARVAMLHRSHIGKLDLGNLRPGDWRAASRVELESSCLHRT